MAISVVGTPVWDGDFSGVTEQHVTPSSGSQEDDVAFIIWLGNNTLGIADDNDLFSFTEDVALYLDAFASLGGAQGVFNHWPVEDALLPATYDFTNGDGRYAIAIITFRGVDLTDIFGGVDPEFGTAVGNSPTECPAIVIASAMMLVAVGIIDGSQTFNDFSEMEADGWTIVNHTAEGQHGFLAYLNAAAGTYGPYDVGNTASDDASRIVVFALLPAGGGGITVTPGVASLTTTPFAPVVATPRLVTPPLKALSLTPFAPSALAPRAATPGVLALTLSLLAPAVSVTTNTLVRVGLAELVATLLAPTVSITTNSLARPGTLSLDLGELAPVVTATQNQLIMPSTLALLLTMFAPNALAGGNQVATPDAASLSLTGFAPAVSTPRTVTPGGLALLLSGFAPSALAPRLVTPGKADLVLASFAPAISTPRIVTPSPLALSLTGLAPVVTATAHVLVVPGAVALVITTYTPTVTGLVVRTLAAIVVATYDPMTVLPAAFDQRDAILPGGNDAAIIDASV